MGSLIDGKLNADGGLSTCPNDVALKSDMAGAFAAAVKARERSRSREAHSGTTELSRLREPSGRRRSDGERHAIPQLGLHAMHLVSWDLRCEASSIPFP